MPTMVSSTCSRIPNNNKTSVYVEVRRNSEVYAKCFSMQARFGGEKAFPEKTFQENDSAADDFPSLPTFAFMAFEESADRDGKDDREGKKSEGAFDGPMMCQRLTPSRGGMRRLSEKLKRSSPSVCT